MATPDKERAKKSYDKKKAAGMVKRSLWVWPETWSEIQAFANSKTDKAELINSVRCKDTKDMFGGEK